MSHADLEEDRPICAGIVAGSVSAIVATVISLPLHSPADPLLNSGTVTVGTLLVGLLAGVLWAYLKRFSGRPWIYAVVWTLGFILVVLVAAGGATQIDRFFSYIVPLAIVVFPLVGIHTVFLASQAWMGRWWLVAGSVLVALGLGIGLAGQEDQKNESLSLPPRAELLTPGLVGQPEFAQTLLPSTAQGDS